MKQSAVTVVRYMVESNHPCPILNHVFQYFQYFVIILPGDDFLYQGRGGGWLEGDDVIGQAGGGRRHRGGLVTRDTGPGQSARHRHVARAQARAGASRVRHLEQDEL